MEDSDLIPSLIDISPDSPMMDRDEFSRVKQPETENLRQKLLAHYQKGIGGSKNDDMPVSFPLEFVNRIGVLLYLFTVISTLKIGLFDVMPLVYEGNNQIVLLQQCLVGFIVLEVMVNWLGIRYVDTSYQGYISANGDQRLHKQSLAMLRSTKHQALPDIHSSSAALMPLQTETGPESAAGRFSSLETGNKFKTPPRNFRTSKDELAHEAASMNRWMHTRNEQVNSKSIADLICITEDNSSSYSTQEFQQNLSAAKADTYNWMSPKPVIRLDGKLLTESYPYWSWVPCYACGCTRPPRCHHCPLCKTCILKRDHHCYFAGSCIGYRNHRFFIVFLFWALIGCVYATLHGIPYIFLVFWSQMSYFDVLFPIAIVRFIFGYLSFQTVLSVTTLTFILVSNYFAAYYLILQSQLIFSGLTSFEKSCLTSSLEIKDTRKLNQKMKAVFGQYWLLNFLIPGHFLPKPEEDPVYWPDIQIFKH